MNQNVNQTASQTASQTVIPIDIHTHFLPKNPGEAIIQYSIEDTYELEPDQYYSFGVHPLFFHDTVVNMKDPNKLEPDVKKFINRVTAMPEAKRIVALGEIGVDLEISKIQANTLSSKLGKVANLLEKVMSPVVQTSFYVKQIRFTQKLHLPCIVHCVKAYEWITENISEDVVLPDYMILHGFRRKPEEAKRALKDGFYLSFGRFFNEETLKMVPDDRLFFETDADPLADIEEIYARAAQVRGTTPEALKDVVRANVSRVFGIK